MQRLNLVAVDVYKIIEQVLRHEPSIPKSVVRHLSNIEQSVLETAVWASDSPIWRQLRETPLSRQLVRQLCTWSLAIGSSHTLYQGSGPKVDGSAVASAVKVVELDNGGETAHGAEAGLMSPTKRESSQPSQSLVLLYRKVLQLVAMRAFAITRELNLPIDVFREIWSALVFALTTHAVLRPLLLDRHIDQLLIVCSPSHIQFIPATAGLLLTSLALRSVPFTVSAKCSRARRGGY